MVSEINCFSSVFMKINRYPIVISELIFCMWCHKRSVSWEGAQNWKCGSSNAMCDSGMRHFGCVCVHCKWIPSSSANFKSPSAPDFNDSAFELPQTCSLKIPSACRSHPLVSPFKLLHDRVLAVTADLSFVDRILTDLVVTAGGGGLFFFLRE